MRLLMLLSSFLVAGAVFAGPLVPPAGPIDPTPGPEPRIAINATNTPGDADSLFKITQPGSYYLPGNAVGVSAKKGIEIAADNVTIDLMGFELRGVAGSQNGITYDATLRRNTVIRNGTVVSWGISGIDLLGGAATNTGSIIDGVCASNNTNFGIRCGAHGLIRGCTANSNGSYGIIGYEASAVEACSATNNGASGIGCGSGATITRCTARDNTGIGIEIGSGVVEACAAYSNTGAGINAGVGSTVTGCTSSFNDQDGIIAGSRCLVISNSSTFNGQGGTGSNIRVSGFDTRIEGNNSIGGPTGISTTAAGNFFARNTCSGSTTNWNIAAGNVCLVVVGVTGGAFSGNSGGVAPGSTDPNANFTY